MFTIGLMNVLMRAKPFAKKIVHLLLLLVIISPIAVDAKELKKGMQFLVARHLLIDGGWQPINLHKYDNNEYFGATSDLINAHIMEVESCAMDQLFCIFNYKKSGKCLRLVTRGEEIKDMRVYHWTYECPDGS